MTTDLQRVVRREFPDFEIQSVYPVALLRYHLAVTAKVLERGEISIIGAYILEAIALGKDTPEEIAALLGIEERYVAIVGVELLRANLVSQAEYDHVGRRRLTLTPDGAKYRETKQGAYTPRTRLFHLLYDPLTRAITPAKADETVSPEKVQKEGLYTLPWRGAKPTLGDITVEHVQTAVGLESQESDAVQVIGVTRLKEDRYEQYVTGTRVFVLHHWETGERRLAAYRGGVHLPDVSRAIFELEKQGVPVIPADADAAAQERAVADLPLLLRGDAAKAAREVLAKDRELGGVAKDLARAEIQRTGTQTERERATLEERVRLLESARAQMEQEQQALLQRLESTQAKVVREDEHRPLLEEALRTVQREVIIISPWITPRAVDKGIVTLLRSAARRGVRIRIAYGLGQQRRDAEGERNRSNAREVRERLFQDSTIRQYLEMTTVRRETHEKILVCDDTFAVATSFNWLSYSGPSDTDQRRETGFIVRDPASITELRERAMELFAPPRSQGVRP